MNIDLKLGDCLQVLKDLPDNSIDSIVTDPPYGIGFMNKEWDNPKKHRELIEREQKRSEERFKEGKSPTKAGFSRGVQPGLPIGGAKEGRWFQEWCEEWGKECLRILKPGGYLMSFSAPRMYHRMTSGLEDAGFQIRDQLMWVFGSGFPKSQNQGNGIGTGLKPAHEPIVMARKPFKGTCKNNIKEWGTGGINIDDCRVEGGRWPANIIFDEGEEPWRKYFYCPKASKKDRDEGMNHFPDYNKYEDTCSDNHSFSHMVKEGKQVLVKNVHPTVKPTDPMLYLIKLVTPKGGIVLDPFMGSGSTGKAAIRGGYNFIGIEKEEEYIKISEARINYERNHHTN